MGRYLLGSASLRPQKDFTAHGQASHAWKRPFRASSERTLFSKVIQVACTAYDCLYFSLYSDLLHLAGYVARVLGSLQDSSQKAKVPSGIATARTEILSVDGSKIKNISMHRSIAAKTSSGNVTVDIESQDLTPETASSNAENVTDAKVISPPPKPPSKEDFVVEIKSVKRVDGKKPMPRVEETKKEPSKRKKTPKSGLDIKVWTVTDAPKARNEAPPSRLEYGKMWADDWGWGAKLHISCKEAACFPQVSCEAALTCPSLQVLPGYTGGANQVMNGEQLLMLLLRERRTQISGVRCGQSIPPNSRVRRRSFSDMDPEEDCKPI
eukprot:Skav228018  [mRNA]  locus=scaffold1073:123480:125598:+ [translate_table: standard]